MAIVQNTGLRMTTIRIAFSCVVQPKSAFVEMSPPQPMKLFIRALNLSTESALKNIVLLVVSTSCQSFHHDFDATRQSG